MLKSVRPLLALAVFFCSLLPALALAQETDLSVLVTTDLADVDPGETLTFTVTLFNAGPDDADDVDLTIDLLSGVVAVSAHSWAGGTGVSCDATLDCTLDLAAGASFVVTIATIVDDPVAPGTFIDMRATVASRTGLDPNEENDGSYTGVFVNGATYADLGVSVDAPAGIADGETKTFTATVTNGGPSDATNVSFTFNIFVPAGTSTTIGTGLPPGWSCIGSTCTIATLPAGSTETFEMQLLLASAPFGTEITTSASITSSTADPNNENDSTTLNTYVVGPATTTTLSATPSDPLLGDTVTLQATVNPTSGSIFNGTVTFYDNRSSLGSVPFSGAPVSITTSSLALGAHGITATYTGVFNQFQDSTSSTQTVTVHKHATTTTLATSPNPSVFGETVTLTATVTDAIPVDTTGTVTFYDGATALGTAPLSGGTATLTTAALGGGTRSLTATYGGDATFDASTSPPVSQIVTPATSGITLASSANPSTVGMTVTFTATVTSPVGTPTGTVTFRDGTTVLGTSALSGGVATFDTSTLGLGDHSITADYSGDADHEPETSSALVQTVVLAVTGTTLTSSANPGLAGKTVTFTAIVAGNGGSPTGTVTFRDGTDVLGTADLAGGTATYATDALALGTHEITATYNGDATFGASTSAVLVQEIIVDTALVEDTFNELTEDFMTVRGKLLAGNVKTPGLQGGPSGPTASFGGTGDAPELNFAMNTRALTGAGVAAETLASGEATDPFGFWIDGTLALHQRPGAGGQFVLLGMGADYLATDTLLAGVAFYLDYMTDVTATGDVYGRGAMIGPYVSAELSDGLYFDASFLMGRSWNDAHATLFGTDFNGSFETARWMLSSSLSGDVELGEILLRPDLSLAAASESSDAYDVTGGGTSVTIGAIRVDTLRVSAGAELSRAFVLENGLTLTPKLGARLGSGSDGTFALSNVFGSVTGGFTLEGDWWKFNAEAQLNGDSTGLRSQSVKLGMGGRF